MIPAIIELQKDTPAGCCVFCQDPIPGYEKARRKPIRCKEPECRKSYHRLYDAGRERNATPEQRRARYLARREKFWAQGLTVRGEKPTRDDVRTGRPRARTDRL